MSKLSELDKIGEYITLWFPNNTEVKMSGDSEIIKQLINQLNGLKITYTIRDFGNLYV